MARDRPSAPVPVLFLTARDALDDKLRGFTLGGDDYMTKPFSIEELIVRVRAILRRVHGSQDTDGVLALGDLELDEESHVVRRGDTVVDLTPTEFKLLHYLLVEFRQGRVEGADPRPCVELRLRRQCERRRDLRELPAQEDRQPRSSADSHCQGSGLQLAGQTGVSGDAPDTPDDLARRDRPRRAARVGRSHLQVARELPREPARPAVGEFADPGRTGARGVHQAGNDSMHGAIDLPAVPPGTFGQLRVRWWPDVTRRGSCSPPTRSRLSPFCQSAGLEPRSRRSSRSSARAASPTTPCAVDGPRPSGRLAPDEVVVVAVPLTEVDQTLGRLLLVELLVSGGVMIVLGALAWWIVRAGLRPLDQMATTAGAIAAGDLTQRVPPGDTGTEVGRLGQALNVMLEEIEESFAARQASEERLRRFLADASHELRTPLTSIRGYAEMFDRGARDRPEDLAMSMRHIRQDADRMSTLVDDLLVLARLDRERPLAHERVDLRPVLEAAVADMGVREPERSVELTAPEPAIVAGDEDRLRQVVDNLLVNAVSHTPAGTPDRGRAPPRRRVGCDQRARPRFWDPPEERERIFEPFYRSDPSRSRATGGEGLGLAIVSDDRARSWRPGRGGSTRRRGCEVLGPPSCRVPGRSRDRSDAGRRRRCGRSARRIRNKRHWTCRRAHREDSPGVTPAAAARTVPVVGPAVRRRVGRKCRNRCRAGNPK